MARDDEALSDFCLPAAREALDRAGARAEFEYELERVFELFPRVKERLHQPAGLLSGGGSPVAVQQEPAGAPPADDPMARFVSTVLADTEDVWKQQFAAGGANYVEPRLVLFRGAVRTACGAATESAMRNRGPARNRVPRASRACPSPAAAWRAGRSVRVQ